MAKRPNRYTEARMYLVGGSIGMLLIVWSALAMKDIAGSATTGAQTSAALVPPAATSQPAVGSSNSSSGGSTVKPQTPARPNVTTAPRPAPKPQTRSRGS